MEDFIKGLYIVATPIGNLDDISFRAKKVLNIADIIICENPTHSLKLLNKFGIKKKLYSLHDYNEEKIIKRIEKYQKNSCIALISDAGSPLISDPGYKLVQNYIERNLMVTTIPGPSSIISAIQLSGLPSQNFLFLGFLPKSQSLINSFIDRVKELDSTSVIFVSGMKIIKFLERLIDKKISRQLSICKEMTKRNENVFRGNPNEIILLLNSKPGNLKGEFVVVIGGREKKLLKKLDTKTKTQILKLLKKYSLTEVVEIVHNLTNISKKEIYKHALLLKND